MSVLMCKDKAIYDITNNKVLCEKLCPVLFSSKSHYYLWQKARQFLKTNRAAEATLAKADSIDKRFSKRRLSLSDCYWVRHPYDDKTLFNAISPYHGAYIDYSLSWGSQGSSVPDATLGGSFTKIWSIIDGKSYINKIIPDSMVHNEMSALVLAHKLGIPANRALAKTGGKFVSTENFRPEQAVEGNSIWIENMTTPERMLLPISWTTPSNTRISRGHDVLKMCLAYKQFIGDAKIYIIQTLLFDAIVANDDRRLNMSNWGYFKNPTTGACNFAPLYDFNLAHLNQATLYSDKITTSIKQARDGVHIALQFLNQWEQGIKSFGAPQWIRNLENLRRLLHK